MSQVTKNKKDTDYSVFAVGENNRAASFNDSERSSSSFVPCISEDFNASTEMMEQRIELSLAGNGQIFSPQEVDEVVHGIRNEMQGEGGGGGSSSNGHLDNFFEAAQELAKNAGVQNTIYEAVSANGRLSELMNSLTNTEIGAFSVRPEEVPVNLEVSPRQRSPSSKRRILAYFKHIFQKLKELVMKLGRNISKAGKHLIQELLNPDGFVRRNFRKHVVPADVQTSTLVFLGAMVFIITLLTSAILI